MKYIPWIIVAVAVSVAVYFWKNPEVRYEPDGTVREITHTVYSTVTVTVPQGYVQGTGESFSGLPVVADGDLPPSDSGSSVIATIEPETGKIRLFDEPKHMPLFAVENSKEAGFRYSGWRSVGYGRWTFARAGSVHFALYGEISTKTDSYAGIDVSYRW